MCAAPFSVLQLNKRDMPGRLCACMCVYGPCRLGNVNQLSGAAEFHAFAARRGVFFFCNNRGVFGMNVYISRARSKFNDIAAPNVACGARGDVSLFFRERGFFRGS